MFNPNQLFAELANIVPGVPVDLSGASGAALPWTSLKNYQKFTIVVIKAAGNAAEDPTITVQQATDVSGTGAKNLASITRIDKKEHATAVNGVGVWTKVAQAAAATFVGDGDSQAVYAIDIKPEDLDVNNNFDCIRATIADVGTNAQLATLFGIAWAPRYQPPLTNVAN